MSEPPVPIVSVRDVQLRYRNLSPGSCVEVLKGIDLDIFEGGVHLYHRPFRLR